MFDWIRKLFGNKFRTGTEIVDDAVGQFKSIVVNLSTAISGIDGDISNNQEQIQALKAKNAVLGSSKVQALSLIRGLNDLLGD